MKKILITLTIMISVTAAAFSTGISPEVLQSFSNEYASAQYVSWEEGANYSKATFVKDGTTSYAFYSRDGKRINLSGHIISTQLPGKLRKQLKRKYAGYWISDLFQSSQNGETQYYITLQYAETKIMLSSDGSSGWRLN